MSAFAAAAGLDAADALTAGQERAGDPQSTATVSDTGLATRAAVARRDPLEP